MATRASPRSTAAVPSSRVKPDHLARGGRFSLTAAGRLGTLVARNSPSIFPRTMVPSGIHGPTPVGLPSFLYSAARMWWQGCDEGYQREFLCGVQDAGGMMALNVQSAVSLNAATDFSGAPHQCASSASSCCMTLCTVRSLKADQLIAGQQVVGGITSQPTGQRFWMASLRKPGGKAAAPPSDWVNL